MAGPGGIGLIPRTGPLRAPTTTAARPVPELFPRRIWLFDLGQVEPPGEWSAPAFTLSASANIAASGADTTTARLTAPVGSFDAGRRVDDSGTTPTTTTTAGDYTEHEWSIEALPAALTGEVYEFRVVRADGTELAAYTVTPTWTIGTGAPTTNAPATVGPVTVSAPDAAGQVKPNAGTGAVVASGQPASGQVRPAAGAAAVATSASAAAGQIQPRPGVGPVAATANPPSVTVLAQAGVAAIGAVAADALTQARPSATAAAIGVAAGDAIPPSGYADDFNRADSADLGTLWTPVAGGMRIDGNTAYAGTLGSTAGVLHRERYDTPLAGPDMAVEGTFALLSTGGYSDLRLMARWSGSTSFYELRVNNAGEWYVNRVTSGGEADIASGTGLTLALPEVWRLDVTGTGSVVSIAVRRNGSLLASHSDNSADRITSGTQGGLGGFTAAGSPPDIRLDDWSIGTAAGPPTTNANAGVAPVALTGQPATATVLALAGVAAVGVAGQAATVNTSSSTNANAGVAAVGVAASAATGQVRPAPTIAPVGATGQFDPGTEVLLQLVMDNPVGITVTAHNATVTTSTGPVNAPATVAPITLTAPAPVAQVRAQAGVAAIGVAALQPAVSTSNQVLAQAGAAVVGVVATGTGSTVRPAAGASSVITSAAAPLGQIAARPGGAAVILAALALLAQARAQAAGAPVAVAGRNPIMGDTGATWQVSRAATLGTYRALLDGVHPTTATIT